MPYLTGYKKRLETRRGLAKVLGRGAYYEGKDGLLPKPLWMLRWMASKV